MPLSKELITFLNHLEVEESSSAYYIYRLQYKKKKLRNKSTVLHVASHLMGPTDKVKIMLFQEFIYFIGSKGK